MAEEKKVTPKRGATELSDEDLNEVSGYPGGITIPEVNLPIRRTMSPCLHDLQLFLLQVDRLLGLGLLLGLLIGGFLRHRALRGSSDQLTIVCSSPEISDGCHTLV